MLSNKNKLSETALIQFVGRRTREVFRGSECVTLDYSESSSRMEEFLDKELESDNEKDGI